MSPYTYLWVLMGPYGFLWVVIGSHGFLRVPMVPYRSRFLWVLICLYGSR